MSQDRRYSFEFFPTKTDAGHEKLMATAAQLASYQPDFFSCTYGAGGSTRDRTINTVLQLESQVNIPAAPHLSCVGDSKADLRGLLTQYKSAGIKRIVALRGDLPSGMGMASGELRHANDLVSFIREESGDHFHIEVAAYPEMHPQARNFEDDLHNFVRKANSGANSAITQYFFNADSYFYFVERVRALGVDIPIVPGIMPVGNFAAVQRMSAMCNTSVPDWMGRLFDGLDDRPAARQLVSATLAAELCRGLYEGGVRDFHFYTLNRAELSYAICHLLGLRPQLGSEPEKTA